MLDRDKPAGQVLRFVMIGTLGAATNFGIYSTCVLLGLHYIAASFLGWFIALLPTFYFNRRLTFRSDGSMGGDFVRTLLVYVGQQLVMAGSLWVLVDAAGQSPIVSYFLALPVAVAASFLGMKYFAMRARKAP